MADVSFGTNRAWKVQVLGEITRAYHWVSDEPAMVIYPTRPRLNAGAYIICLSSAFKYDDMAYLVKQAAIAASVIGMTETGYAINKIGTAIHDGLLDLIQMPPEPQWVKDLDKGAVFAELEIKADGKTIIHRDVHEGDRGTVHG